ncbi:MAG: 3-methyl-2-oxobutanoate dehydrogenase subunit VorB [bacterium]|nr:3-methyl-2-oxobutanoate dehydrogenase subunit VorB [bacterium]
MAKVLMKGNEAIGEAAIRAGCRYYFGYPITPQNELTAYMSKRMEEVGGVFIQAESELAAINMVYGASAAGGRAMTSSSSPGISLKQEGISYMVGAELPGVVVNICRGGPGLGNIAPSQSDYFQATRGGGHGDYYTIVLSPSSVQESADLVFLAFYLADKYRNPVIILGDGFLGQMLEPVEFKNPAFGRLPRKRWALTGAKERPPNVIRSLYLKEGVLEKRNWELSKKYERMKKEVRYEGIYLDDAEFIVVAYGICARISKASVLLLRAHGLKVGLIRPITLWPFPSGVIKEVRDKIKRFFVIEMNLGQMVEDVKLAVEGRTSVSFYGRPGGGVPTPEEIYKVIKDGKGYF